MARFHGFLRALLFLRGRRSRPGAYHHGFGVVVAFLNGILLLRFLSNIYIIIDVASRRATTELSTFLAESIGWLAVYGVTILPVSSYRYARDAIYHPRLLGAPYTRGMKSAALAGCVLSRPTAVALGVLAVFTIITTSILTGTLTGVVATVLFPVIVLCGIVAVTYGANALSISKTDIEYVEIALSAMLVLANPDITIRESTVHLTFFLNRLPELAPFAYVPIMPAAALLVMFTVFGIIGLTSKLSRTIGARHLGSAMKKRAVTRFADTRFAMSLYLRRSSLWFWIVGYLCVIPVAVSRTAATGTRRGLFIILIAISIVGFVRFAAGFESEILARPYLTPTRRQRITLFGLPFLVHTLLATIPIVIHLISKGHIA